MLLLPLRLRPVRATARPLPRHPPLPLPDGTLVLAETGFESKFSPFFAASASDQDVIDLTQIALLGADRKGEMVLNGIEGETREYNGTDYTYHGPPTALSPRTPTAPSPMTSSCART